MGELSLEDRKAEIPLEAKRWKQTLAAFLFLWPNNGYSSKERYEKTFKV